jgi:hypothetical protein
LRTRVINERARALLACRDVDSAREALVGNAMLQRLFMTVLVVTTVLWPALGIGQTDDPGPVRVGDRWTYEVKDAATEDIRTVMTYVVVDIDNKEISTRVNYRGKDRPRPIVFDSQWAIIDDSVWKYRPAGYLGIKTPLQVGKTWRSETNATNIQNGTALRTSSVTKVVSQEKITTRAGTFDTYRVETNVTQTNSKDATKISRSTFVDWYAPTINRWVKRTFQTRFEGRIRDSVVEELTEYSRKP